MPDVDRETVLREVSQFYLKSRDFNGIPAETLANKCGVDWFDLQEVLRELITEDMIGILYSDDINPHINRTGFKPKEKQIAKLKTKELYHTCIYPQRKCLKMVVDQTRYKGEPYRLSLALGEPHLAYRSFDLSVLEFYRNDPRYLYKNNDINGCIYLRDEYFTSNKMAEHDRVMLQTFGFSYDPYLNRAVAVYLWYLANLSAEHQQIWKAKELHGDYKLHPDYFRTSILGGWGERVSIFNAFIKELYLINQMTVTMGRSPLFHQDFGEYGEDKPTKFSFMVRPTLEEFNNFVHLLDKLLSENINKEFFQNEVPYKTEIKRNDGKVEVQNKGTLQILDDWIRKFYNTDDWSPWDESIKSLRDIRKIRQMPAHAVNENIFDQKYFKDQRELIRRAYSAVRTLRLMLENHPAVKSAHIKVPDWLREGRIWRY